MITVFCYFTVIILDFYFTANTLNNKKCNIAKMFNNLINKLYLTKIKSTQSITYTNFDLHVYLH